MQGSKAILRLRYEARQDTMLPREIKWRRRFSRQLGTICYDPLERSPILRWRRESEKQRAGGIEPALPNLLAAYFHFRLPPRLFGGRRAGSDSGFFSHGS
jgi:hypothetical protein